MPSLVSPPALAVDDALPETYVDRVKDNLDYLTVAGADLASAATIVPTHEFHTVTGTTTIDNIDHAAEVTGQQVRLYIANGLTIRNNGAGTGNIRTRSGRDLALPPTSIASFVWTGSVWREQRGDFSGKELAYVELTAAVNIVGPNAEASATTVATAPAVTFDGVTRVEIELYIPRWHHGVAREDLFIWLYQDGASIGQMFDGRSADALDQQGSIVAKSRIVPAAGARTYSARASVPSSTAILTSGPGGLGATRPGHFKITAV